MTTMTATKNDDRRLAESLAFCAWVESVLRTARKTCAEWGARFAEDPSHAMRWSQGVHQACANLMVYGEVERGLKNASAACNTTPATGMTLAGLREYAQRMVLVKALHPERNTSAASNEQERCVLAAWAEVLENCGPDHDWFPDAA
jgi:hypothetical protein